MSESFPAESEADRNSCAGRIGRVVKLLSRSAVGAVFAYAGVVKLGDPGAFADAVWNYRLLPDVTIYAVALILPPLEVLCGGLLIAGCWRKEAYAWLILLSCLFIEAQAQAWGRGLDITCGCFGVGAESPLTIGKMGANVGLLLLLGWLACSDRERVAWIAEGGGEGVADS